MLYLIRFEVRQPDGISLSELQDIWHRELVAREPHSPGIVQSFKAMGRRTIFVVAEFPDDGALDEALARLPIVEELGSAVEIELIPAWPFDHPGGPGQALARPVEEPAQPDVPGRASTQPEEVIRSEQTDEEPERVPEPEEPARRAMPERTPTKPAGKPPVPEASIDREPPREAPLAVEPGEPEDISATGLIRSPDTPGRAPAEPEVAARPRVGQQEEPPAAEPGEPEDVSATGLIRSPDTPGRAPAGRDAPQEEAPAGPGQSEETSVTGVLQTLDAQTPAGSADEPAATPGQGGAREEEPATAGPEQPQEASVTGLIRSLGAPGQASTDQDAPQEEAPAEARQSEETSVTGVLQTLDAQAPTGPADEPATTQQPTDQGEPREETPTTVEPEQPQEASVTGLIRSLDAPGQAPTGPAEEPAAAAPGQPEEISVTGVLRSLDALEQDPVAVKPGALPGTRVSLQVQSGSSSGEVFEVVGRAGATIGRSPDNSIQISGDSKISRRHVRIEFKDGDYWLTDLGSSYGTFVNQARLNAPRQLRSGDVIELGETRMTVSLEAEAAG